MIKIVDINLENKYLLKDFLDKNSESLKTFRYYNSRNIEVINKHLTTRLYFVDESCVGYGHLDFEEKFWLGICVSDSERGKKYGDFILKDILSTTNECIYLTVDILNIIAQNLYKKHGFEVENIFENIILMKKKHN